MTNKVIQEASAHALRTAAANPDTPPAIAQAATRYAAQLERTLTDRHGARIFQNCGRQEFARAAKWLSHVRQIALTPDYFQACTLAIEEAQRIAKGA